MTSLFNQEQTPSVPQEGTPTNVFSDQLSQIVNDQGAQKYETVDVALEALKHSQAHIPGLESKLSERDAEIASLREEMAKVEGVQALIDKHTANLSTPVVTPQVSPTGEQDVALLVTQALEKQQLAQTEQVNFESVQANLTATYGDKAPEVIALKAQQLNTTPAYLEALAKSNPTMLLTLLGQTAQVANPAPTYGSVTIPSLNPLEVPVVGRPEESLLSGAKPGAQMEFMKRIKAEVYRDLGVITK